MPSETTATLYNDGIMATYLMDMERKKAYASKMKKSSAWNRQPLYHHAALLVAMNREASTIMAMPVLRSVVALT